jgi:hypothetical protein
MTPPGTSPGSSTYHRESEVPGIVAYLIAWVIVPWEPLPEGATRSATEAHEGTA